MTDQIDTIATNLERIRSALQSQRVEDALAILQEMHPADQAELFNFLSDGEQILLLSRLDIPSTADLLEELEDSDALDAVESLDSERLADLLDEMEPDEAADLI